MDEPPARLDTGTVLVRAIECLSRFLPSSPVLFLLAREISAEEPGPQPLPGNKDSAVKDGTGFPFPKDEPTWFVEVVVGVFKCPS